MVSKKISLAEATKEFVYSDLYGFVNSKVSFSIVARALVKDWNGRTIDKEVTLNQDSIYVKKKDSSFVYLSNMHLFDVFKLELYALRERLNNGYYGGFYDNPRESELSKLDNIKKIILKWQNESVEGSPNNKKAITEFLSKEVYEYSDDFNKSEYLYDYEIEEKQFVRFKQGGTYKVVEVYPQPNKENMLCRVCSVVNGSTKDIPCSTYSSGKQQQTSTTLYKIPYGKYPKRINELEVFDSELCEFKLNPFWVQCQAGNHKGNLYWQPIEEAASYKVSLYKYRFEEFVEKKLYLLEEFEIDRNKHWLTIDNLYGENYIIRLTAENRNGMPIAISRGIPVKFAGKENKAQYWNVDKN